MQARIKRQGDWALNCTSGHDLERRFIDTINDGCCQQLVLVPVRESLAPDLGLCAAVLALRVGFWVPLLQSGLVGPGPFRRPPSLTLSL